MEARRRAWHSARLALRYYEMPFGVFLGAMAFCRSCLETGFCTGIGGRCERARGTPGVRKILNWR